MSFSGETAPEVIVVGSGPAGVSAAWPLVRAGLRVLMLDAAEGDLAGRAANRPIEAFRNDPARWADAFGQDLAGLHADPGISPKFATPLGRAVLGGFAEANGLTTEGFLAAGALAAGGLSNIWGALATPFDDEDLKGFPGGSKALAASYASVAQRIGLSGDACGGDAPVDGITPLTAPAARLLARRRPASQDRGFVLKRATNAVITQARDEREGCNACGLCLYGCSRGAIYSSASELPALKRFHNFAYISGHRVVDVSPAPDGQAVEAIVGGVRRRLIAERVVLAAGTIATSGLALRRLGLIDHPVRLLSNPTAGAAFLTPALIGCDLPEESFGLGQLFYELPLGQAPGRAAGVLYGADTLPLDLIASRLPLSRPVALRAARALAPAVLMASCYLPGAFSNNRLVAGRTGTLRVEGHQTEEAESLLHLAMGRLSAELRPLGAWRLPKSTSRPDPRRRRPLRRNPAHGRPWRGLDLGRRGTDRLRRPLCRRRRGPAEPARQAPHPDHHGQRRPHRPRRSRGRALGPDGAFRRSPDPPQRPCRGLGGVFEAPCPSLHGRPKKFRSSPRKRGPRFFCCPAEV